MKVCPQRMKRNDRGPKKDVTSMKFMREFSKYKVLLQYVVKFTNSITSVRWEGGNKHLRCVTKKKEGKNNAITDNS